MFGKIKRLYIDVDDICYEYEYHKLVIKHLALLKWKYEKDLAEQQEKEQLLKNKQQ